MSDIPYYTDEEWTVFRMKLAENYVKAKPIENPPVQVADNTRFPLAGVLIIAGCIGVSTFLALIAILGVLKWLGI